MDIGSLLLILAVTLLVALYICQPFLNADSRFKDWRFRRGTASGIPNALSAQQSMLLAERDRALKSLRELEFDYALGKIQPEDYPVQRTALLQAGAVVLQQLDALKMQKLNDRSDGGEVPVRPVAEEVAPPPATSTAIEVDELELLIADRRRGRQEKAAGFCAQCGAPLQKSDKFCPRCGQPAKTSPTP